MARETDGMVCRACGNEGRAWEGYPCEECGTFVCLICSLRGVTRCKSCAEKADVQMGSADLSSE